MYTLPRIIRMIYSRGVSWIEHDLHMGKRGIYRDMVGKTEGERPLARLGRKWEDNTKMVPREKE